MSTISSDMAGRLARIRLMLSRAEQEATQASPFASDAINRLHDVTEMFLALAARHHNKTIPTKFEDYWPTLDAVLGRPLGYRTQMQTLNKARVNLKHYGTEPSHKEIRAWASVAKALIYDECPVLFGVKLEDISLSSFVTCAAARALLNDAEVHWKKDSELEAFADLSQALDLVIHDYRQRKLGLSGRSVFDITSDMARLTPFFRRVRDRKQKKFEEAVIASIAALDRAVMLVGLGIDLRRYARFSAIVPEVDHTPGWIDRSVIDLPGMSREQSDFEFCRDFVVATALHLAEFDYDLDLGKTCDQALDAMRAAGGPEDRSDSS